MFVDYYADFSAKFEKAPRPENTGVEQNICSGYGVEPQAGVALIAAWVAASIFDGGDLRFSTNLAGSFLLYRETVYSSSLRRSTLLRSTVSQSELKSCSAKNFVIR